MQSLHSLKQPFGRFLEKLLGSTMSSGWFLWGRLHNQHFKVCKLCNPEV